MQVFTYDWHLIAHRCGDTKNIYIEIVVTCPRLLKRWVTLQLKPLDFSFQQIVWFVLLTLIHQITIDLVDNVIQP